MLQDFFVKNISKVYAYEFLAMLLKFYWQTLEKNVKALCGLGVNENLRFSRFLEHISRDFNRHNSEKFRKVSMPRS